MLNQKFKLNKSFCSRKIEQVMPIIFFPFRPKAVASTGTGTPANNPLAKAPGNNNEYQVIFSCILLILLASRFLGILFNLVLTGAAITSLYVFIIQPAELKKGWKSVERQSFLHLTPSK